MILQIPRFFNYGECPSSDSLFKFDRATFHEKLDGSLIILYWWDGAWRVNTRNSYGFGIINDLSDKTWNSLFFETIDRKGLDFLNKNYTYCFELCSPFNMVVTQHKDSYSYLLGIFDKFGNQIKEENEVFKQLKVKIPEKFSFNNVSDILDFLEKKNYQFEGIVAFDGQIRVKIKNPLYVAVHHTKSNINSIANLVKLILAGESEEFCNYFPNFKEKIDKYKEVINSLKTQIEEIWSKNKNIENQKEFAQTIKEYSFKSLLFSAKKSGKHPLDFKENFEKIIISKIKN